MLVQIVSTAINKQSRQLRHVKTVLRGRQDCAKDDINHTTRTSNLSEQRNRLPQGNPNRIGTSALNSSRHDVAMTKLLESELLTPGIVTYD